MSKNVTEKRTDQVVSKSPINKCPKCDRPGVFQIVKVSGGTHRSAKMYTRIHHGATNYCQIGQYLGSDIQAVIRRYSAEDERFAKVRKPETITAYKELITDLYRVSKVLDEPRYKSIRPQLLHELFWMLPVDSHESKSWQLRRYGQIVDHVVDVVNKMNTKTYKGESGWGPREEFVKVLKNWGVWKESEIERHA